MASRRTRRSTVRPASTMSMILVAGLPKLVFKDATLAFGEKFPHTIIKGTPTVTTQVITTHFSKHFVAVCLLM